MDGSLQDFAEVDAGELLRVADAVASQALKEVVPFGVDLAQPIIEDTYPRRTSTVTTRADGRKDGDGDK
ncbi:MAG: hypothetical protein AAB834_08020 [Patescibacteria group bacterium]